MCPPHQGRQFLIDNLNDGLGWGQGIQDILSHGPFFNFVDKVLNDFKIYVRFQKGHPHVAHGFVYLFLRQFSVSPQFFERRLQALG